MQEIRNQIKHAEIALSEIKKANKNRTDPLWLDKLWLGIQSFATSCSNISKIIEPIKGPSRQESLGLQSLDLSPIMPRDWRNHLDHYDERISAWFENKAATSVGSQDRAIGSIDDIGMSPPPDQLRRFDPSKMELYLRSKDGKELEEYDLIPVITCLLELKENLTY